MKITKIAIGKGRSVPKEGPEGEWVKVFYHVEAEVSEGEDPEVVRIGLEATLDSWLAEAPTAPEWIPKLDEAELEELPWQTRDKQPAKPGQWAWLFGPESKTGAPEKAQELVKAIEASKDRKLEFGAYEYTLSEGKVFIQRRPAKKGDR